MTHPQLHAFMAAVNPAMLLFPPSFDTMPARALMWSIGRQESRMVFRFQKVTGNPYARGPARGLWQFERAGGVAGVLTHPNTRALALKLCAARDVLPTPQAVHPRLEFDDVLAAGFARLLLRSDPRSLPALDASPDDTWAYYLRNWRPGKPHRESWDAFHREAVELFGV